MLCQQYNSTTKETNAHENITQTPPSSFRGHYINCISA